MANTTGTIVVPGTTNAIALQPHRAALATSGWGCSSS